MMILSTTYHRVKDRATGVKAYVPAYLIGEGGRVDKVFRRRSKLYKTAEGAIRRAELVAERYERLKAAQRKEDEL